MDLQGAELLALKGLGNYLNNVRYIHIEVSHKEMYSGQVMYSIMLKKYKILCHTFVIVNIVKGELYEYNFCKYDYNQLLKEILTNLFKYDFIVGPLTDQVKYDNKYIISESEDDKLKKKKTKKLFEKRSELCNSVNECPIL